MTALYNEIEPFAALWLRNLATAGLVAPGTVDERSIREVSADDLDGACQAHFFAGVGVWSYALRRAGWPDDVPVWTGSCPCQPFSAAGKRGGFGDDRHLWPEWFRLIRECRPSVVLGEQVASPDGLAWFDLVSTDLEAEGYAVGAADLCAAGVGAPHIRQRLYFVAYAAEQRHERGGDARGWRRGSTDDGDDGGLANAAGERRDGLDALLRPREAGRLEADLPEAAWGGEAGELGDTDNEGPQGRSERRDGADQRTVGAPGVAGFWADAEWIPCTDGKSRPVEPGAFPLATGAPSRVGRLRAYGNALNAETATTFIRAVLEDGALAPKAVAVDSEIGWRPRG